MRKQILFYSAPLVGLLAFLIIGALMLRDVNVYDEGIILTDGMLVLNGKIPHRDFYANYGPAQYCVLALIFKNFGIHFFAARIYDALVRALSVMVFYFIVGSYCSEIITALFTIICLCWYIGIKYYLYPVFPCILLALTGSYLVVREVAFSRSPFRCLVAGACTALTALFRYDAGFFLLVAHFLCVIFIRISINQYKSRRNVVDFIIYIHRCYNYIWACRCIFHISFIDHAIYHGYYYLSYSILCEDERAPISRHARRRS